MKQFKVGDQVQKIGALVPGCLRDGVVVAIKLGQEDWQPTKYEVEFKHPRATLHENQLQLIPSAGSILVHIKRKRLHELSLVCAFVDQPECIHIKHCGECLGRFFQFVWQAS